VLHQPVLLRESLDLLKVRPGGIYVDATVGTGGHAEEILKRGGRLLGIDRDASALEMAQRRLQSYAGNLKLVQGNFAEIAELHAASGWPAADGILADLGLSSWQLADASRGFSFQLEGPLDMRMDVTQSTTAGDLVNRLPERDLADLIFRLGEERHSRHIARAIVKARPILTTTQLAQVVTRAIPSRAGLHQIHPATRTFMALRLAVNAELDNLAAFLGKVLGVLAPAGRLVIISFHSLEDRMVKQRFAEWRRQGLARILTRRVVRPGEAELRENPRSRSAKLRAAEKSGDW
jgi:16S rRNA (cytosine1402-N4)-methyltransferase